MASGRKVAEVFVEVRANLSKLKSGMKSAMSIASGGASVIGKVLGGLANLIKNVLSAAFKVVGRSVAFLRCRLLLRCRLWSVLSLVNQCLA